MAERISPTFTLECEHCRHRWPHDAVVEAMLLHFQVEHDTDEVRLELTVVCTCRAAMALSSTSELGGGAVAEWYTCPACGNTARVRRKPDE